MKKPASVALLPWEVVALQNRTKTQVRRPIKLPRWSTGDWANADIIAGEITSEAEYPDTIAKVSGCLAQIRCPYGYIGDSILVQEQWVNFPIMPGEPGWAGWQEERMRVEHRGTFERRYGAWEKDTQLRVLRVEKWKSAASMPLEFARFALKITKLRVEKYSDMTNDDAKAEGVTDAMASETYVGHIPTFLKAPYRYTYCNELGKMVGRSKTEELWDSKGNGWAWVIEFEPVKLTQ